MPGMRVTGQRIGFHLLTSCAWRKMLEHDWYAIGSVLTGRAPRRRGWSMVRPVVKVYW